MLSTPKYSMVAKFIITNTHVTRMGKQLEDIQECTLEGKQTTLQTSTEFTSMASVSPCNLVYKHCYH
jgi:hypothetical protein